MTQTEITEILKAKGYEYMAGVRCEVWLSRDGAINSVEVYKNGLMDFYIANDDGDEMASFTIENPTPELLKQIL